MTGTVTPDSLRQTARELLALADSLEAGLENSLPPKSAEASRARGEKSQTRNISRLTPEERQRQSRERWALYGRYDTLWMEVGDGKGKLTFRFFAEYHHLTNTRNGSEVSRWLSATGRRVPDGSPFDLNIRRALTEGIRDLEAKKAVREAAALAAAARAPKPNGRLNSTTQSPLRTD